MVPAVCNNLGRCLDAIPHGLWSEGSGLAITLAGSLLVAFVREVLGFDE